MIVVFTVNSTGDGADSDAADVVCDDGMGNCTLRAAIQQANALVGLDGIAFDIPGGGGVRTISPASALPAITDSLFIDGYTQPGASENSLADGSDAVLLIELDGTNAGAGANGLTTTAGNSTIRGLAINRFSGSGIRINTGGGSIVAGCFVGTNAAGDADFGNGTGVFILNSPFNIIGGTTAAARNVVSGNNGNGVYVVGNASNGNAVQGNLIGTDAAGSAALGNSIEGVRLENASGNTIGGTAPGAGNRIAFNGSNGVLVLNSGTGNAVRVNSIFDNGLLGIDHGNNGVTANDAGDGDTGPNNLQNFPVLTSATSGGGTTTIQGTLSSTPSTTFSVEFFSNTTCDPSGNGEGRTFLGSTFVTTGPSGVAAINVTLPSATTTGESVTATATDPAGNTSEFSACGNVNVPPLPTVSINDVTVTEGNGATVNAVFNVTLSFAAQPVTVNFATADGTATTADNDYQAGVGMLIFAPGETTQTITVVVNGDAVVEAGEQFFVNLSAPTNATLADGQGVCTISNDDPTPAATPPLTPPSDNFEGPRNSARFSLGVLTQLPSARNDRVQVTQSGGVLQITPLGGVDGAAFNGYVSEQTVDLTVSPTVQIQVIKAATGEGAQTIFSLGTGPDDFHRFIVQDATETLPASAVPGAQGGGSAARAEADTGQVLIFQTSIAGAKSSASIEYNSTQHRYWRFRYDANEHQLAYDTSPNAIVWTEQFRAPIRAVRNLKVEISAGTTKPTANPTAAVFDDLELRPAVDNVEFFVRQQYLDFLNREPDRAGYRFWLSDILECEDDKPCIEVKRINVSAAFFLSIEFQETGFLVYRMYKGAFGRMPRLAEFRADTRSIGRGVVVGVDGWEQLLANNKGAFAEEFVNRTPFTQTYDQLGAEQYVDALLANAGVQPSGDERATLIISLVTGEETRGGVLLRVAEKATFRTKEFNNAFVLLQYFGYLNRNPDDPPDHEFAGYNFWLNRLNQFEGDFRRAEMVKAFITSIEYRERLSRPASNQ